jgi:hypothetical protein
MTSPYLDRPLLPLAVALPRMLEKIEADLVAAGPGETQRLCRRADLIREVLVPIGSPPSNKVEAGHRLGSCSS